MEMNSSSVNHTQTWVDLLEEHRRKTKWTCACGWDGREGIPAVEHERHLATHVIHNIRYYEGSLANILRSLFAYEQGAGPTQRVQEPRYMLKFRSTASISRPARGVGGYGAAITALYFDDRGEVLVADLSYDGQRWVITPHKKAEHGEVLKLQHRIGTNVWLEPE